jgi:organic radical activating enzyme
MLNEGNFCIGPWSEIQILPDGQLNWCHFSSAGVGKDYIQNIDLDLYFNGDNVKKIRTQLQQGTNVPQCQRCYNDETKIVYSYRRRRNIQMAIFPGAHFEKSVKESVIQKRFNDTNIKPYFYNIILSNLCNLSCVMCSPNLSSRVATDFKKLKIVSASQPSLLDWTRDDITWKKFVDHIDDNKNIVCVHFQGGEPLLHARFEEFLNHCVRTGHTDFHLTMVTNGTIFKQELIDLFRHFKSCQIEISVETMTSVNEYIRYPVDHTELVNNIKKFLACRDDQLSVVLRSVPQLLNVLDYVSLLKFCLENSVCIDSNIVDQPVYLKPNVWPDHIRFLAQQRLEQFKSTLDVSHSPVNINLRNQHQVQTNLKQNVDLVIAALNEPLSGRQELQAQAKEYFDKIDRLRRLSVTDYCPEFADIYG